MTLCHYPSGHNMFERRLKWYLITSMRVQEMRGTTSFIEIMKIGKNLLQVIDTENHS